MVGRIEESFTRRVRHLAGVDLADRSRAGPFLRPAARLCQTEPEITSMLATDRGITPTIADYRTGKLLKALNASKRRDDQRTSVNVQSQELLFFQTARLIAG